MNIIYNNIKELMSQNNLMQKDLAAVLHVNKNTIINWFKLNKGISAGQVPTIAKYLRCSIAELYGEEEVYVKHDQSLTQCDTELKTYLKAQIKEKDKEIIRLEKELLMAKQTIQQHEAK